MTISNSDHTCHFRLEERSPGDFTGNFSCEGCGRTLSESQWLDIANPFKPGSTTNYER